MSIISAFAGTYSALDFAFGTNAPSAPPPLQVGSGNTSTGSATITILNPTCQTQGGVSFNPIAVGSSITVGNAAGAETVTVTAVGVASLAGAGPGTGSVTVTAVFANTHGPQEYISSATFGLMEAVNYANAQGGGLVTVTPRWYLLGGTVAMLETAGLLPTNGTVQIKDALSGGFWGANRAGSVSLVAAPSIPLITQVASTTATGTWTAVSTLVKFAYVTRNGGVTTPSSEYTFTATVSKAIGGTGPIAATDVVGYLVFIGTTTNVNYQVTVDSTSGTPITCGGIVCFQIGTSFSSAAITTVATDLPPVTSNAFASVGAYPTASSNMLQPFQTVFPPFANITTVTAGTAQEWAKVDLPAGFLNYIGRTLRITLVASFTPGSTATLIPSLLLESVYGTTTTTLSTVTTAATSGTTQSNLWIEYLLIVAATGTAGTIESHMRMTYQSASASPPAALTVIDSVTAASGAANLVTQDTLSFQINSGTANLSSARVRQLIIEVLV